MLWNQFVRCTGTCLDTPTHAEKCTITYIVSVNKLKEEKYLIPFEFIEEFFVFYLCIQMLTITFIPHSACKNLSEKISSRSSFLLLHNTDTPLLPRFRMWRVKLPEGGHFSPSLLFSGSTLIPPAYHMKFCVV